MIKTLLKEVKEYKFASIITPCFMVLEVAMEMMIPYLMASIIDKGVEVGNMAHIYKVGGLMIVIAVIGLLAGLGGARFGAMAATGFAKNLREKMFNHIQTFSFVNSPLVYITNLPFHLTLLIVVLLIHLLYRHPYSLSAP